MSPLLPVSFSSACLAAAVLLLCGYAFMRLKHHAAVRLRHLDAVEAALHEHYDAVDRLLADDEFPEGVKPLLEKLAEAVTDRSTGLAFGHAFADRRAVPSTTAVTRQLLGQVWNLKRRRPDLVSDFELAMRSASAVMLLRWPENAALLETMLPDIVSDRQKERAVGSKLAEIVSANDERKLYQAA